MRVLILALLLTVGLSSCASISEDECRAGNWDTIGFRDGAQGKTSDTIDRYAKDCAAYGISPDLNLYLQGRDQGLLDYCRISNGYAVGSKGQTYNGVCPAESESAFLTAYNDGRVLYDLRDARDNLMSDITDHERRLDDIDDELTQLNKDFRAQQDANIRTQLKNKIVDLNDERASVRDELGDMHYESGRLDSDLFALEADMRARYGY